MEQIKKTVLDLNKYLEKKIGVGYIPLILVWAAMIYIFCTA